MDPTTAAFLGTLGLGLAGLAWKIFADLNKIQDTQEAVSFQRKLNALFGDFQALSMTPRMIIMFRSAARRSGHASQTSYFSEPEAQVQLGEIGGALSLLLEVARCANAAMDSLSNSGIVSAVGSALILGTVLLGLVVASPDLVEIAICEFAGTILGVSYFYSRFRLKKSDFFDKEQGFRSFLGG